MADGKAWLGLFLDQHLTPGSVSTELRNLVNAAWDLAQHGTHGSTEDVHAFAVVQAVILIARVVQKLRADQDVPALPAVPEPAYDPWANLGPRVSPPLPDPWAAR